MLCLELDVKIAIKETNLYRITSERYVLQDSRNIRIY